MYTFFAYLARLKYIRRWGLMRNSFPENDAEQSLQTAMIAHGLALIRSHVFHEPCDEEHCAMLALYHDVSEVFTGDMPTPVKYFTKDMHARYAEIEEEARQRLVQTLPEKVRKAYVPYICDLEKDDLWPLAKAADILSAYLKCAEEKQAGNSEFEEAFRTTEKKLKDLHMKEVDWFIENFAGSFLLTLDKMNQM